MCLIYIDDYIIRFKKLMLGLTFLSLIWKMFCQVNFRYALFATKHRLGLDN